MSFVPGFLLVWRQAFRQSLRGRRGIGLVLLAGVPLFITTMIMMFGGGTPELHDFHVVVLLLGYRFVLPFGGLLLGIAVLGDEIEGRTITYLFTRPLPRPVFYLGRLLGYTLSFGLLAAASLYLTELQFARHVDLEATRIGGVLLIAFAGFAAYAAFLAALRALFEKALYIGFFLVALVEWALASLPASGLSKCSIWHHLAVLQMRLFENAGFQRIHGLVQGVAPNETARGSAFTLAAIFLVSAAIGAVTVRVKEIKVPAAVA
jgi:ABC-type transport system involved in multi-copper enzyme maturation permease subunit